MNKNKKLEDRKKLSGDREATQHTTSMSKASEKEAEESDGSDSDDDSGKERAGASWTPDEQQEGTHCILTVV
jgi:hypothetical protein